MKIGLYICECGAIHVLDGHCPSALCIECKEKVQKQVAVTWEDMRRLQVKHLLLVLRGIFLQQTTEEGTLIEPYLIWATGTQKQAIIAWCDGRIQELPIEKMKGVI